MEGFHLLEWGMGNPHGTRGQRAHQGQLDQLTSSRILLLSTYCVLRRYLVYGEVQRFCIILKTKSKPQAELGVGTQFKVTYGKYKRVTWCCLSFL